MVGSQTRRAIGFLGVALALVAALCLSGGRVGAADGDEGVIYFPVWDDGGSGFCVMSPDGTGRSVLPADVWGEASALNHDGRWFLKADAVGDTYPDGRARLEIFAIHEDGSPSVQLTDGKIDEYTFVEPNGLYYYIVQDAMWYVQPRWTDGDRLVSYLGVAASYDAQGNRTATDGGLYTLTVSPSSLAEHSATAMSGGPLLSFPLLTSSTTNSLVYVDARYDWSPDGDSIAYGAIKLGTNSMHLADASDGFSSSTILTTSGWGNIRWSPIGDRILFTGGGDIRSIETDGTDERMLVEVPPDGGGKKGWMKTHSLQSPSWSPDATHFVYQHYYRDASKTPVLHEAWLVRATASGGDLTTIAGGQGEPRPGGPMWCATEEAAGPTVTITAPSDGASVWGTVTLAADASGDAEIDRVEFFVDGVSVGTDDTSPYSISWDSTAVGDGSHTISATAHDTTGGSGSDSVTVSVDNVDDPPTVRITSPAAGATVSGTVTIAAQASDDGAVAQVSFLVDGGPVGTDATSPYQVAWNSTTAIDGAHTITAVATDDAGKIGLDSRTVVVQNTAPAVTVVSITPNTMKAGASIVVTIGGTGFVAGATVRFANGTGGTPTASGVTVASATAITATVKVSASGAKGVRTWDVVVTNPGGATATLAGGLTVVK